MTYMNSNGSNQTVQLHSLIRTIAVHLYNLKNFEKSIKQRVKID